MKALLLRTKYFVKKVYYYFKKFKLKADKLIDENIVFFIIDPELNHPGLVDRLNAIVSCNIIAQLNGFEFKIIFEHPFILKDYFDENELKWHATEDELSFSFQNTRILNYTGYGKIPKLSKRIKQYHIYFYEGQNILANNYIKNASQEWFKSFNMLFKPSLKLTELLNKYEFNNSGYVAVHLRFVNVLEHFEQNNSSITLNKVQAKQLIADCLKKMHQIQTQNKTEEVVVFSDSQRFLEIAKKEGYRVLDGDVGHITFQGYRESVVLKTFVDFVLISRAKTIYRLYAPFMYRSAFAVYAALSGGKDSIFVEI